jgi:WD40 repeat protein
VVSRSRIGELKGHESLPTQVVFNHRGDMLASSGWDNTVRIWDVLTERQVLSVTGISPRFSSDDRRLALAQFNPGRVSIFAIRGSEAPACRALLPAIPRPSLGFSFIAAHPAGRLLATASRGVHLWDLSRGGEIAELSQADTRSVLFEPSGGALIACGQGGVQRWPMRWDGAGETLTVGPPEKLGELSFAYDSSLTADGRTLATTDGNDTWLIDLQGRTRPRRLPGPADFPFIAISPDGRWVARGSWHRSGVSVYDTRSGALVRDLPVVGSALVMFSPDGRRLLTSAAAEYCLWEVGSWRRKHVIQHFGAMMAGRAVFSPDARVAASDKSPTADQLIEIATGRELASLEPPGSQHHGPMCFSADGSQLIISSPPSNLRVWDLRVLRSWLAPRGLDWEMPDYPAAPAAQSTGPLRVQVLRR